MSILPIGTIVYLKDGSQKLMILNRGVTIDQNGESVLFDYSAAFYPIGLNPEQLFYFNREDVDKVVYPGYSDEENVDWNLDVDIIAYFGSCGHHHGDAL